jgi:hypothetical protein
LASDSLASDSLASDSLLDALATDEPWEAVVAAFRTRMPGRAERIAVYDRLLADGVHRTIGAAVLAGRYRPAPPAEAWLNKADGRKKRVFLYEPADELLFRVVNRLVQPAALGAAAPSCTSFLPGGGARAAFRRVLSDHDAGTKAALRLDVRDYFNSIDVDDLLSVLPEPFVNGPLGALLAGSLRDPRVLRRGRVVDGGRKGVMAGTPLAPMLATLYLRDLDQEIAGSGATYARYSDDLLVLAAPQEISALEAFIRDQLTRRGLVVNEEKSRAAAPGHAWDFLGFRYERGAIALAPVTVRKFEAKTTRLARRLLRWREQAAGSSGRALGAFVRRVNRRVYGVAADRTEFSWATWFLPLLDRADDLGRLDRHVQREGRYAATGCRRARSQRMVPYENLRDAGYLPLVTAYWTARDGRDAYDTLVTRRTGVIRASTR